MPTTTTTLLLIDVQKDFHPPDGSLAIPNADQDAERIATLIRIHGADKIDRIVATMDSHQKLHIAHPDFWRVGPAAVAEAEGNDDDNKKKKQQQQQQRPDPFTIISADDLIQGIWKPRDDLQLPPTKKLSDILDSSIFPEVQKLVDPTSSNGKLDLTKYCIEYTRRLEQKGRFQLCIWPEHCLMGSAGHGLVTCVMDAIHDWSHTTGRSVEWVWKGQHLLTEMYSAMEADVPVSKDSAFNETLQASLEQSDRLIVCGQAMSHCVNYTLRDIVSHWSKKETSKIELLTDCASAVPGFEDAAALFQKDMEQAGVKLRLSSNVF